MAVPQAMTDALKAIDDRTTELAAVVAGLRGRITTAMSQADVDAVVGQLGEVEAHLKGIAADPANPLPGAGAGAAPGKARKHHAE